MENSIKKFATALAILFSVVVLLLAIGMIWDTVTHEVAKEILLKVSYTTLAIFGFGIIMIFLDSQVNKK